MAPRANGFTTVVPPGGAPTPPPPGGPGKTLPGGWQAMDGPTGRYYFNVNTKETTWTTPDSKAPNAPLPPPMPPPPGPPAPNGKTLGALPPPPGSNPYSVPSGPPPLSRKSWTRAAGPVGADTYAAAYADPRYQTLQNQFVNPLRDQGMAWPNQFAPAQIPPGGGAPPAGPPPPSAGGGGKGGEAKPQVTLSAHRLRAMPFLARNMGVISGGIMMLVGFTMAVNYPYRDGITTVAMQTTLPGPDGSAPTLTPRTIQLTSDYGYMMIAVCAFGGLFMMCFEYYTYGNAVVRVEPFLWRLRVGLYGGIGFACVLGFAADGLMPPLLPGIMFLITAAINVAATRSTLPSEKEWRWAICGAGAEAQKKAADAGGKVEGYLDKLMSSFRFQELFEQGHLPRVIFLAWYFALNVAVGLHAYFRHGYSEKGKAMRGEAFLGCPGLGENGLPRITPLPVCNIRVPCLEPEDGWRCPNGVLATLIPEATPPLLQEFWVGFGWLGYPTAKMMGQLLNLNCAVLLMPVTHSMITRAHDLTSIYGPPWLRWLSVLLPFDKAVVFHKACAKYFILPCVAVHGFLHYFNYGRAPYYNAIFGDGGYPATPAEASWSTNFGGYGLTGNIIVLAMFVIYSGAHERVRRARPGGGGRCPQLTHVRPHVDSQSLAARRSSVHTTRRSGTHTTFSSSSSPPSTFTAPSSGSGDSSPPCRTPSTAWWSASSTAARSRLRWRASSSGASQASLTW